MFIDESGHDHRQAPDEVRGGVAVQDVKLWPLLQAVRRAEEARFGVRLSAAGSEVKGEKLLRTDRFRWAAQGPEIGEDARRKHSYNFLQSARQQRSPRRDEFTAFGQSSIGFVQDCLELLRSHDARLFATAVPCGTLPTEEQKQFAYPPKNVVFLLERFFYFLEEKREAGLLIMDGTERHADKQFVRRMEAYFSNTSTGRYRTQWIVPEPLFVDSDLACGVQLADICIYLVNWGYRFGAMTAPTRPELTDLAALLKPLVWHGASVRDGREFRTHSVAYVPDPYEARRSQK